MFLKAIFLILVVTLISGCASHTTLTGKAYPSVQPDQVKILFKEKPKCKYEELGFISTPLKWNQNVAITAAREKAAEIGADYVMVETVHVNAFNDASVSAIAYKCGSVSRENIPVSPNSQW